MPTTNRSKIKSSLFGMDGPSPFEDHQFFQRSSVRILIAMSGMADGDDSHQFEAVRQFQEA